MREFKKKKKKKTNIQTKWQKTQMDKSSAAGFSSSLSVFRPSHLIGALHAGVLRRNRRRHHGQDALWRLAVTVQTGSTGRPGNAGCTGNTAGSPQTFTTVFTVSWSTGVTWENRGFIRTLWPTRWLNVWVFVPNLSIYVCWSVIIINFETLVLKLLYLGINNMINTRWITDYFHIKSIFISDTTKLHILKLYIFKNVFSSGFILQKLRTGSKISHFTW